MSRRSDITIRTLAALFFVLLSPSFQSRALAQDGRSLPVNELRLPLRAGLGDSLIHLPDEFIAPGTDTLTLDGDRVLTRGMEYSLSYRFGTIRLDSLLLARTLSVPLQPGHWLTVRYEFCLLYTSDAADE